MFYDFLLKGGIIMWPILLCSIFSVAIIFERLYFFYKAARQIEVPDFICKVKESVKKKKYKGALNLCQHMAGPLAAIISVGIGGGYQNFDERQRAVSRVGSAEVRKLEKNLSGLALIADITPLMGLLGTIMGLIKAFMKIQAMQGHVDAGQLAGGIWEALITTAAGLIVAIPTLAAYHYFEKRVSYYASFMKETASELLDMSGIDAIEESAVMESDDDDRI
ncbi:MAG: MotA/TolQ/ExbB proton channel family protein [Candidatus Ancaeobacter aquaticus]|nr:MotA/TolQ/ExbB proton channel family protein [Candidatus Ancaeobacter aquaticus]